MNIQEASIATGISKDMIRFYEKKKKKRIDTSKKTFRE